MNSIDQPEHEENQRANFSPSSETLNPADSLKMSQFYQEMVNMNTLRQLLSFTELLLTTSFNMVIFPYLQTLVLPSGITNLVYIHTKCMHMQLE